MIKFFVLLFRSPVAGQLMVNSLLEITLRELDDFGLYSCAVRNVSSDFSLDNSSKSLKMLTYTVYGMLGLKRSLKNKKGTQI